MFKLFSVIRLGENLTDDSGWILPTSFSPEVYQYKQVSCEWTIFSKSGMSIRFEVLFVRVEESPLCDYYLQVSARQRN